MGMHDEIMMTAAEASRLGLVCGDARHPLKQFQCEEQGAMSQFLVVGGRLFRQEVKFVWDEVPREYRVDGDTVFIVETMKAKADTRTGECLVQSECRACEPVYYEFRERHGWGEIVREIHPCATYRLRFERGVLAEVVPVRVETRGTLRLAILEKYGGTPLADDDVLVLAHKKAKSRKAAPGALAEEE